jgi:predicted RNA methylase
MPWNNISQYHLKYNNKIIYLDKLFPRPPTDNYNDIHVDIECITYITNYKTSEIIISIILSLLPENIYLYDLNILDGTACIGGDTIAFGNVFNSVISVEIDKRRYDILSHNLNVYNLYNVFPINDDITKIYKRLENIDIMYFDPPWGGRNYKKNNNIRLTIGKLYIDELVNTIFDGSIKSNVKYVILKLPNNYNIKELYYNTKKNNVKMLMYNLKKMLIVVYVK